MTKNIVSINRRLLFTGARCCCVQYRTATPHSLNKFSYSLATGELGFRKDKIINTDNPTYQNQHPATILASDALLWTIMNKPGKFQLMFWECMQQRQKTSHQFQDLCSAFQLKPSRTFNIKARPKEMLVLKRLDEGLNIQPHDLPLVLNDNVGFKKKNEMAWYDQWSLAIIVIIVEVMLQLVISNFWSKNSRSKV